MPTSPPTSAIALPRPRIEVAPPYVGTYGPLAGQLMARAGKPLDPWQQDAVDLMLAYDEDRQWVCFEYCELCSRQNGKGALLEARVLFGFLVLGEELIMWSAHQYKTAKEAFRRMRKLLRKLGTVINDNLVVIDGIYVKIHSSHGFEGFERVDTEARIQFIARSKDSGRGLTGDLNIIDEAYDYDMSEQEALGPTMLAVQNPQFIYTSSPPLSSDSGEILYSLRDRAMAMIEDGEEDALGYRDWGMEGDLDQLDGVDFDDPANYRATNPALHCGRVTIPKIKKLRKMLGTRGFGRECFGLWPRKREGGGAFDLKKWAAMLDEASSRWGDVAIAVDIEPERDYAAIGLAGVRVDELEHWQMLDFQAGVDWVVDRVVEHRDVLRPIAIAMGSGTFKSLETALKAVGITPPKDPKKPHRGDLMVLDYLEMSAATGLALDVVNERKARHIGQEALNDAVRDTKVRRTTDSIVFSRKDKESRTSPIVTVAQARYALDTWLPVVVDADYDVLDSVG
ncbi:hypothetical protein SK571_13555 [Lentzea sp. BCCO 10_0798]|uniref:Phage terminase-like protein, large subunit, contains N-terminal HTH domain n=1 Tax=Lentzea kristufekii TaxID=3095430 RepID=A0ABU4TR66_9PSEU|nr:hypothetical protein [Lentzea sp. BCCO 10_0798]MDX8050412.1 hypothetical protein [Lentzea sp. BCCO 10_0798]